METAEGGVCANTGRSRGTSGRRLPRRRTVPDEGLILRRRICCCFGKICSGGRGGQSWCGKAEDRPMRGGLLWKLANHISAY
ncbi:hypothetical protein GN956_G835 [Arapaima gigas]